jgi:hypothetical protein
MVEESGPLAGTAASLVASTALGATDQPAELAAWPGLARLLALLNQAAVGDPALHAALAAVTAAPEDPGRVAALAHAVDAGASRDRGLRAELARLLDQARQHPTAGALVTQIGGYARVGKLVTIGHAGAIHVHLPPSPPATVLDRLPPTRLGPVVANLPPRNPNFTGRADLLDQLHQRLHPGQATAVVQVQAQTLHGMGGVGKTQLAIEYAHRHAGGHDLIWWVAAEQPVAIPGQLVTLARRLGLPEHPDQAETIGALWDALRQRDRWLLIFDNAEDPADLRPWWPPDSGRVLVTSRNPTWAGLATTLAVDVLPRTEAVAFLYQRLGPRRPQLQPAGCGARGSTVGVGAGRRLPRRDCNHPGGVPQPTQSARSRVVRPRPANHHRKDDRDHLDNLTATTSRTGAYRRGLAGAFRVSGR